MNLEPQLSLVRLKNGACSLRSNAHQETYHPVIGPAAEAEALYVRQLDLKERLCHHKGEFVVWDVGLGAAANALAVAREARQVACNLRMVSFDWTLEPLRFGWEHQEQLGYFKGYEPWIPLLLKQSNVEFSNGAGTLKWDLHVADFPSQVAEWTRQGVGVSQNRPPAPHAILFDAYSPAKNPAMWTHPLFAGVHQLLDPTRPCLLATYSRSTQLRAALLLAGFFVGRGGQTGEKEETTVAANDLRLIKHPLDQRWLERARRSSSAEPLWEPQYRQAPLCEATWARLLAHPQFQNPKACSISL